MTVPRSPSVLPQPMSDPGQAASLEAWTSIGVMTIIPVRSDCLVVVATAPQHADPLGGPRERGTEDALETPSLATGNPAGRDARFRFVAFPPARQRRCHRDPRGYRGAAPRFPLRRQRPG